MHNNTIILITINQSARIMTSCETGIYSVILCKLSGVPRGVFFPGPFTHYPSPYNDCYNVMFDHFSSSWQHIFTAHMPRGVPVVVIYAYAIQFFVFSNMNGTRQFFPRRSTENIADSWFVPKIFNDLGTRHCCIFYDGT